jgi:hypothetical protein
VRRASAILVVAGLLGGAAALWFAGTPEPGTLSPAVKPPATAVTKAGIVLRHRGRKQAAIEAERVEVSADGRTTLFLGQPRVVVYEGEVPSLTVTGMRIRFDRATQDVRVEGGLRVTTVRGETLTARAASWDPRQQVMDLSGPVEATFPLKRLR